MQSFRSSYMMRLAFVALSFAGWSQAQSAPASKHLFGPNDWARLRSADAAAVSPDGTVLYAITFGGDRGATHKEWWTMAADGSRKIKIELPVDFSPIGFTRSGLGLYGKWKVHEQQQLALYPLGAKHAKMHTTLTLLPRGIESAKPSPDGKHFAILADPRPVDALRKIRNIWEPDQTSLFVVNSDGSEGHWWCSNLNNLSAAAWSGNSESVAVLSHLPRIGHHEVRSALDVCGATSTRHVTDVPNVAEGIAWSRDGRELVFLSTKSPVLTPEHVWTVAATGGTAKDRTPELDGTAVQLNGDARGNVWVMVNRGVRNSADEFLDNDLTQVYQWPDGVLASGPISSEYFAGNQIVLTVSDPAHPRNVAVPVGNRLRKLTSEGDAQLTRVDLGAVRVVHWKSSDGMAIEGIATFPAGFMEGQKYPFLVLPHSGPETNDQLNFDVFPRMFAGLGYVVLQPEYRGSTGYGAPFMAAIYQHRGDQAYEDVNRATDYAIAQGWADPSRLAIFGWSAGGFMTAWTVTQTNRYKAAIDGAGVTDWASFLWTSDIQQIDYDARWTDEDPAPFQKFSPTAFAYKVKTPLLILHGEADKRVPLLQALELFQLLSARGNTVRMVTYPGSPHFPLLWEQRLDVMREVVDWLLKYNK